MKRLYRKLLLCIHLCLLILWMTSCYEASTLPLDEICHPADPKCASEDFDGDGVPNGRDEFPLDERCSEETKEHCGICDRACGDRFTCQEGICMPIVDELCDGLDNDLDQVIDESLTPPISDLNLGVCAGLIQQCSGVDGWVEPSLEIVSLYEETESLCDGFDNDCDGQVDELLIAPLSTPQVGVCTGLKLICEGEFGWVVPDRRLALESYEISESRCDQLDNDCDGRIDERLDGAGCQTRELGRCAAGQEICIEGEMICESIAESMTEVCNAIDDDCDGQVDEAVRAPRDDTAFGVCQNPVSRCERGIWQTRPIEAILTYEIVEESCDGLDNDCDGFTDENFSELSCTVLNGIGPCAEGIVRCVAGEQICRSTNSVTDESCDGIDNDCDGAIDEDLQLPLFEEQRGVCAGLASICDGDRGIQAVDPSRRLEYELEEQSCDGLDNDCDGVIDENVLSEECLTQEVGLCQVGLSLCVEGQVICFTPDPQEERCDGLDNDCDGAIDEALIAPLTTLHQGVCSGRTQICRGLEGWQNPEAPLLFERDLEQSCDGLDNDCDGIVDEQIVGPLDSSPELLGVCRRQVLVCDGGQLRVPTVNEVMNQQIDYEVEEEVSCDFLDNDCDGQSDEEPLHGWGQCDTGLLGACQQGISVCANGTLSCVALQNAQPERCDGLDNDCDELIDEELVAGSCALGIGACLQTGVARCIEGAFRCDAEEGLPQDERCNAVDDDCDGEVDERFDLSSISCSAGVGACIRQGDWECELGILECTAVEGPSSIERCDGIDNDCDGQVDEDYFQLARPCVAGVGECLVRGVWRCSDEGELQCGVGEGIPQSEQCDQLDNDCDGQADEHISEERCDQVDNDCDGVIDEAIVEESCNQSDDDCDGVIDESPCGLCLDGDRCPLLNWYSLPTGDFLMGGTDDNNQPIHPVQISSFQMSDEITVAQYRLCVEANFCNSAGTGGDCNFGQVDRDQHPINCISWLQAHDYAYWVGGRLPSEAEWEYAARGGGLGASTPWGGDQVNCEFALLRDESGYACGLYSTVEIQAPRHQAGVSPQGLWDLLGNVSEWVEDDYVPNYDQASPQGLPYCDQGICDAQGDKVHRGGGWRAFDYTVSNRTRTSAFYQLKSADIGFRVVRHGP
jgi:formylglycine-generating enzyme required for sulfatase activity